MARRDTDIAMLVLAAASRVVEQVQAGVEERGFTDIRPLHGFAFARIAAGDATAIDVGTHLGVTKQAASQLVQQLVDRGYVRRIDDPQDARRHPLVLTRKGIACTEAANDAAAAAVAGWRPVLGATGLNELRALLGALDLTGPVRPTW